MNQKKSYKGGCGCLLVVLGGFILALSIFVAVVMVVADIDAGHKHEAWVEEYNHQVAVLDSIQDESLRDSLIAEIPRPYIRQGGFAAMFGLAAGGVGIIIGAVPLIIGIILIFLHRRNKESD